MEISYPEKIYNFVVDTIKDFMIEYRAKPQVIIIGRIYLEAIKIHLLQQKIPFEVEQATFMGIKLIQSDNIDGVKCY